MIYIETFTRKGKRYRFECFWIGENNRGQIVHLGWVYDEP